MVGALLAGVAIAATACGSSTGNQLLVAGDTSAQDAAPTDVWAVAPGDPINASAVVSKQVARPLGVSTIEDDGLVWTNQLGREWEGRSLLSFQSQQGGNPVAKVTTATPGGTPFTLDSSTTAALQPVVLRRGVAVIGQDGCKLATGPTEVKTVGKGSCQISADERWVISWSNTQAGPITIRDLRSGSTRTAGSKTLGASVIDVDARLLGIEEVSGGYRGVVYGATDGKEVGHTATYDRMVAFPGTAGATGFVALAQSGQSVKLLWISTSGEETTIDSGPSLYPVMVNDQVTYLRFASSESGDSIRRWTPSGSKGTREVLLTGRVGAAQVAPDQIIATKDSARGVAFYRTAGSGELEKVHDLVTPVSGGSTVDKLLVQEGVALMQVTTDQRISFVRVPLEGDGAATPIRSWPYLVLESVDVDGTALLTGARTDSGAEQVLVVGPHDEQPTVRATADRTGTNLIHEGVVYWTDQPNQGRISVRSVRATGEKDPKVLYRGRQIAGATWPENNGATESTLVSRVALIQQQQQAQQQQQQQQGSAGTGATATP